MAVHWTDILDWPDLPNDYGRRFASEGICFHTTEPTSGERIDLAALITTFRWQARTGGNGGSYNMGVGMAERGEAGLASDATIVTAVPIDHIAGGISTRRDYIWAPSRYPVLAAFLSDRTYNDPNGGLLNIVVQGRVSWWMERDASGRTRFERAPALIDALARIVIEVERRYKINALLCEHYMWQTNRSDADGRTGLLVDLVLARYHEIKGTETADTDTPSLPDTSTSYKETMSKRMFVPQPWIAAPGTKVYQSPSTASEVIAELAGGPIVSIEEQAELRDGSRVTTGPWRTVVLGDWRTGFTHRDNLTPATEGFAEFTSLIRHTLFNTDLSNVQSPDELLALVSEYRIKLEEAQDAADEMQATIDSLEAAAEVDPAALAEAVAQRDDALAAAADLEARLAGLKGAVQDFVAAADALREAAA